MPSAPFTLRYDLRCPPISRADPAELARTAIEQCAWADALGCRGVTLAEHHGSPDGYLPSPLVLGAAIAARTEHLRILLGALIAPLHDPLRLAEDLAMLDVISGGRIVPVVSGGYVAEEFAAFGAKLSERAERMEAIVPLLDRAWSGEPFEHNGTTVRVTPVPVQRPRPPIWMGGSSEAAARRAARLADGFLPTRPEYWAFYRDECQKQGKPDPGAMPGGTGSFMHVAEDPDAAWERIAPFALHETNAYAAWAASSSADTGYTEVKDPDALRATGNYPVLTPDALVERFQALGPGATIMFHPLMGGMDPELSWESLRLFERAVLPRITD